MNNDLKEEVPRNYTEVNSTAEVAAEFLMTAKEQCLKICINTVWRLFST